MSDQHLQYHPAHWMRRALNLAEKADNRVHPNPRVGCVLVKNDVEVGAGRHQAAGQPHAEPQALNQAGEAARGATCYVTLEPCNHHGKTGPCVEALVAAGVAKVVVAMVDPDPRVSGSGIAALREAGIACEVGVLQEQAQRLNRGFVSRVVRGRPWVRVKMAISLDGRIAEANGNSQWITGPQSRLDGHTFRARADAILTGAGTVRADDPQLTVRNVPVGKAPQVFVLQGRSALPAQARVLQSGAIVLGSQDSIAGDWRLNAHQGFPNLRDAINRIGAAGYNELHVEAGGKLVGALTAAGLVDEWLLYQAPVVLGDRAQAMCAGPFAPSLDQAPRYQRLSVQDMGDDVRLRFERADVAAALSPDQPSNGD